MTDKKTTVKADANAEKPAEPTYTPRENGAIRMANSKGWEYWIKPKDVATLLALKNDKAWSKIADPEDGVYGPTGPPRKGTE